MEELVVYFKINEHKTKVKRKNQTNKIINCYLV